MSEDKRSLTPDDEHDIIEFSDDEGNTLMLEVLDYFFYNGEEFAVLSDAEEVCDCDEDSEEECDCEQSLYIMRVLNSVGDDGEEMEEFVPVEDELMDQLIEVVQTRFSEDEIEVEDDDDDDEDDFEDDAEDEDEDEDKE